MPSQPIPPASEPELIEIFRAAMQDERRAQSVYTLALGLTKDPALRPILQQLIDDEKRHEQILLERVNALVAHGPTQL